MIRTSSSFFRQFCTHACAISDYQKACSQKMKILYPELLSKFFLEQVVYTVQKASPKQIIAQRGFIHPDKNLWYSNSGTGQTHGAICFSYLPEVAALFIRHEDVSSYYLYAVILKKEEYFIPGSPWREVISPGAFFTQSFLARQILAIDCSGPLKMGPLFNHRWTHFNKVNALYLENRLCLPPGIDVGEDYPLEYHIKDTPESAALQEEILRYQQRPYQP